MRASLLTILIFLLICSNTIAQKNTSGKEAKEFQRRTLIVGLEEMNPKILKKLKDSKLENYKNQIEGNNYALKTAVEKCWKFNTVKFLPLSEAKELMKNNSKEYALLSFFKYVDYEHYTVDAGWSRIRHVSTYDPGKSSLPLQYNPGTHYMTAANQIMSLNIDMPSTIYSVSLPNLCVSLSDAVYGIKQMEYVFNRLTENDKLDYRDILKECNDNTLKSKTLLLCKDDLDKKLDEEKIKNIYPYKFKIVTIEEIDKAIVDQDNDNVIVQIVSVRGSKGNVSIHYLADTNTGRIVGYVVPTISVGLKGTHLITYNQKIKEKHLKDYLEIANCK